MPLLLLAELFVTLLSGPFGSLNPEKSHCWRSDVRLKANATGRADSPKTGAHSERALPPERTFGCQLIAAPDSTTFRPARGETIASAPEDANTNTAAPEIGKLRKLGEPAGRPSL